MSVRPQFAVAFAGVAWATLALAGCSSSQPRDLHYGTDAGSWYVPSSVDATTTDATTTDATTTDTTAQDASATDAAGEAGISDVAGSEAANIDAGDADAAVAGSDAGTTAVDTQEPVVEDAGVAAVDTSVDSNAPDDASLAGAD